MTKQLFILLFATTLISTSFAGESCRDLIVDTYKMFGVSLHPMSFSGSSFEELGISAEDLNAMEPDKQQAIYTLIKPMALSVEDTVETINNVIERYTGTEFELQFADQLQTLRGYKDQLRGCESK